MNKIDRLFAERGDKKLLSLYFCAGTPTLEGTAGVNQLLKTRSPHGWVCCKEVVIP